MRWEGSELLILPMRGKRSCCWWEPFLCVLMSELLIFEWKWCYGWLKRWMELFMCLSLGVGTSVGGWRWSCCSMNEGLFPLSLLELKMISIKTVVDCVLRCNEEVDVVWMRICGGVFRYFNSWGSTLMKTLEFIALQQVVLKYEFCWKCLRVCIRVFWAGDCKDVENWSLRCLFSWGGVEESRGV